MADPRYTLTDLLRVMERLRDPEQGCPWDLEQDFDSIVPSTLEECYELAAAIAARDYAHVEDELGDVLFQVIFYSQLGRERDLFDFHSVLHGLVEKLLRRHPHVFAGGAIEGRADDRTTREQVGESWEQIKAAERAGRQLKGALADVPLALPALTRAQKLQKRAARVGFDWSEIDGVLAKIEEEIGELREAVREGSQNRVGEEVGDVLFSCVNLSRHLSLDAEAVLRAASGRFEERFNLMETLARRQGSVLSALAPEQLDALWREAKAILAQDGHEKTHPAA